MTKWHIRDELNHDRAACAPHGERDLIIDINDWIGRITSDQCSACAKKRALAIKAAQRDRAFANANARHPLPISGAT